MVSNTSGKVYHLQPQSRATHPELQGSFGGRLTWFGTWLNGVPSWMGRRSGISTLLCLDVGHNHYTALNQVQVMDNGWKEQCRIWELIPVRVGNSARQPSSSSVPPRDTSAPPYEENPGNHCCSCSHSTTEQGGDGFGTTVVEVTTSTTRRKYRLEG